MTLDSNLSKAVYQGNGSTTVFPFAFKVWNINHIAVTVTDAAGVSTDVTSNSTVALTSSGGSVTYPKTGAPLPDGAKLAITRNMPFTQGINLTTASRFDPQVLEDGLDQATAERQQILEQMARAVILPATSSESPEDVVASIYTSRDAAAASANTAETSATAAELSASTAAETVQTATAEAVNTATTQATAASASATAAQASADAAAAASEGIAPRMDAVEAKNTEQDARLYAINVLASSPKYELGEVYYFRHPTLRSGFQPCQGGIIADAATQYPDIWAYLQTAEGQLLLKTEADWQAMSTATWATLADGTKVGWNGIGGAPYFVQDLGVGTLRMPDLRGMYPEAAGFDALGVGGVHGDMIRNITGNSGQYGDGGVAPPKSSALYAIVGGAGYYGVSSGWRSYTYLDISRVVPTGNANKPRAWGALACCYLGQPPA